VFEIFKTFCRMQVTMSLWFIKEWAYKGLPVETYSGRQALKHTRLNALPVYFLTVFVSCYKSEISVVFLKAGNAIATTARVKMWTGRQRTCKQFEFWSAINRQPKTKLSLCHYMSTLLCTISKTFLEWLNASTFLLKY